MRRTVEPLPAQAIDPYYYNGRTSMSLHSIIEPAGTLLPGWKLVPRDAKSAADIRNEDDQPLARPVDEGDRCLPPPPHAETEDADPRSRWEGGKIR